LVVGLAQAQMYRWVDQDGKLHFTDQPPPPGKAAAVTQRKFSAPAASQTLSYATRQAAANYPVTLYVGENCPPCQEARAFLTQRGIPFTEKSVASNETVEAVKKLLGGNEAQVPVLQVGSKTSAGYLDTRWAGLLDAAGYP
jgi:glutaredoxin